LILYTDATLEQITQVRLHPTGRLFLSEIILPGRLGPNSIASTNTSALAGYFQRRNTLCRRNALRGKAEPIQENSFFVSTCDLQHFHCVARYEHETIERRARRFRSCGLLGNDRRQFPSTHNGLL